VRHGLYRRGVRRWRRVIGKTHGERLVVPFAFLRPQWLDIGLLAARDVGRTVIIPSRFLRTTCEQQVAGWYHALTETSGNLDKGEAERGQ